MKAEEIRCILVMQGITKYDCNTQKIAKIIKYPNEHSSNYSCCVYNDAIYIIEGQALGSCVIMFDTVNEVL